MRSFVFGAMLRFFVVSIVVTSVATLHLSGCSQSQRNPSGLSSEELAESGVGVIHVSDDELWLSFRSQPSKDVLTLANRVAADWKRLRISIGVVESPEAIIEAITSTQIVWIDSEGPASSPGALVDTLVRRCPRLESLRFCADSNLDRTLSRLESQSSLTELTVTAAEVDGTAIGFLSDVKTLRKLTFENSSLSEDGWTAIGVLSGLEELTIISSSIKSSHLLEIESQSLVALALLDCQLDKWPAGMLRLLPRVVRLDFSYTTIRNNDVEHISRFADLKSLSLRGTLVDDEGVSYLATDSSIKSIDLSETAVTDKSVPMLLGLENLQSISVDDTKMSAKGIALLDNAMYDKLMSDESFDIILSLATAGLHSVVRAVQQGHPADPTTI